MTKLIELICSLKEKDGEYFLKWLEIQAEANAQIIIWAKMHWRSREKINSLPSNELDPLNENDILLLSTPKFEGYKKANLDALKRRSNKVVSLLEEFLAIQAFRNDENAKRWFLIQTSFENFSEDIFSKTVTKTRRQLRESGIRDESYFVTQHHIDNYQVALRVKRPKANFRNLKFPPPNKQLHFDLKWSLEIFKYSFQEDADKAKSETFQKTFQLAKDTIKEYINLLEERLWNGKVDTLNSKQNTCLGAFLIYYITIFLHDTSTLSQTKRSRLVELFKANHTVFSKDNSNNMYRLLQNGLNKVLNGEPTIENYTLLLSLNAWGMDAPFSMKTTGQSISRYEYKNLISLACHCHALSSDPIQKKIFLEKAKNYLETYKNDLSNDDKEVVYPHCKDIIKFSEGKYDEIKPIFLKGGNGYPRIRANQLFLYAKAQYDYLSIKGASNLHKCEDRLADLGRQIRSLQKRQKEDWSIAQAKVFNQQFRLMQKLLFHSKNQVPNPKIIQKLKSELGNKTGFGPGYWLLKRFNALEEYAIKVRK